MVKLERIEFKELKEPRLFMGTLALHRHGNFTCKTPCVCYIYGEQEQYYVGFWAYDYPNFYDILFPKTSTKELNPEEDLVYKEANPKVWKKIQEKYQIILSNQKVYES